MWDQVEGAELHYSDLKEEQRSSSLPGGWKGGRCEGQVGLGGDGASWGLSDDAKAFWPWEYQVSLGYLGVPSILEPSLTPRSQQ